MSDEIQELMLPGLPHECPDVYLSPANLPASHDYFVEHTLRFVTDGTEYNVVGVSQDWLNKLRNMIGEYLASCGPDYEAAMQAVEEKKADPDIEDMDL